jgi:hypothetical protein
VKRFRTAIALDPGNAEPWMYLGETFNHLIPTAASPDSQAEHAYRRARELDPTFAPVLFHLIEFAVRRGDAEAAEGLLAEYRAESQDSAGWGQLDLMVACIRGGLTEADLRAVARQHPGYVFDAAQSLALGGLRQPGCARAAWEAILESDTTTGDLRARYRFASMLALHGLLVAQGREAESRALLEGDTLFAPVYRGQLYILATLAGGHFEAEAAEFADRQWAVFRANPQEFGNDELWFLGSWLAHQGRYSETMAVRDKILSRLQNPRRDSLLAISLQARGALARGDSAGALRILQTLSPNANSHQALTWTPWESLGHERLLLARLLLARRQHWEALYVTSGFDSPVPIAYLMYLPASLQIRAELANRIGMGRLASASRHRLAALRTESPIVNQ